MKQILTGLVFALSLMGSQAFAENALQREGWVSY